MVDQDDGTDLQDEQSGIEQGMLGGEQISLPQEALDPLPTDQPEREVIPATLDGID